MAKVDLGDIPPAPRGEAQIELTVVVDRYCRLHLVAKDVQTGKSLEVETKEPNISLDQNAIQKLIDDAEEHREKDQEELREIEIRNKAEQLLKKGEDRLRSSGDLSGASLENLNTALAELGLAVQSGDVQKIKAASSRVEFALAAGSGIFGDIFSDIFGGTSHFSPSESSSSDAGRRSKEPSSSRRAASSTAMESSHHIFGSQEFTPDPSLCFVLMPFSEALRPIYDDHIRDVVEGESLSCIRADEIVGVKQITADIWEYVNRARFLVADLTGMNPNVFYELGLAHALGKPVILLAQSLDDVPFDLKVQRCLIYEFTPRGMKALEQKLRRTIREIINA